MRLRRPRFPKALQLRSCRRKSFLWCALTSGLSLRSTRSSIGLASSQGHSGRPMVRCRGVGK
jgi:hypothetical protein